MMRTRITGLLGFIILFSGTELHELARIPELVAHYFRHQQDGSRLDFWSFLQLHYTDVHPDDNDEQEDGKLPFKSPEGFKYSDQPWEPGIHPDAEPLFVLVPSLYGIRADQPPLVPHFGIFHPPRIDVSSI
ncbi:MAG: hypothetical protein ACO25B_05455 [Chitinophagaceae bacterium]